MSAFADNANGVVSAFQDVIEAMTGTTSPLREELVSEAEHLLVCLVCSILAEDKGIGEQECAFVRTAFSWDADHNRR